ncbi:MAG: hypothetical protein ISS47_05150 [Candidatus Omnitrophica bacterium]|nr:hypothetical protein [Candidatus Omnitrophota bacterium]
MEYALYLNNLSHIKDFLKKEKRITRLYFGEEFCEYNAPGLCEIKEAYEFAKKNGLNFTYLTGKLPQKSLNQQVSILTYLNRLNKSIEIVFNDWGLLHILSKEFNLPPHQKFRYGGKTVPVIGRLLFKNTRMPRYTTKLPIPYPHLTNNKNLLKTQMKILSETNLSISLYRNFLKRYKIKRIECDLLPQGLNLDKPRTKDLVRGKSRGFSFSFYTPYSYVTSSRTCELAGLWQKEKARKITKDECLRPCRRFYIEFKTNSASLPIKQFGNSIFFENTMLLPRYNKKIFNRCVIESFL